jgi:hypothetical protein
MKQALELVKSSDQSLPECCITSGNPDLFFKRYEDCVHVFQLGFNGERDILPEASGLFLALVKSLDECVAMDVARLTSEDRNCYFREYFRFLGSELIFAREAWLDNARSNGPENTESHGATDAFQERSISVNVPSSDFSPDSTCSVSITGQRNTIAGIHQTIDTALPPPSTAPSIKNQHSSSMRPGCLPLWPFSTRRHRKN